jgi:zinc transport system ATP-binding protein
MARARLSCSERSQKAIPFEGEVRWSEGTKIGYVPQKLDLERDIPITGIDFLQARAALSQEHDNPISDVMKSR